MNRRGTPEADLQRCVVQALQRMLPAPHGDHSPLRNEVTKPGAP